MGRACLISTTAKIGQCYKCRGDILTALDEGVRVKVDHEPLAEVGAELKAVLAGKRTFAYTSVGELVERTAGRIEYNSPKGSIHVEHYCKTRRA